jgi:hypothetical protein
VTDEFKVVRIDAQPVPAGVINVGFAGDVAMLNSKADSMDRNRLAIKRHTRVSTSTACS